MSSVRLLAVLAVAFVVCSLALGQDSKIRQPPIKEDLGGEPLPAGAVARLGTTHFRHTGMVTFVGYSSDGSRLVTASSENRLSLWDVRTGRVMRTMAIKPNPRRYSNVGEIPLLSGDGKRLLVCDENEFTMIDTASGKTVNEFRLGAADLPRNRGFGPDEGPSNQLSHDGKLLVLVDSQRWGGGNEAKIALFDTSTGKLVRRLSPKEKGDLIFAAALSRDGKTLLCVEGPNPDKKPMPGETSKTTFRFWDVDAGAEIRSMNCPFPNVTEIRFSIDGKSLFLREPRGNNLRLLDAANGNELRQFSAANGNVRAFWQSGDKTLFMADFKRIAQFDLGSGKEVREIPLTPMEDQDMGFRDFSRNQFAAALSPDGKTVVLGEQATLKFVDVASGKEKAPADGHRNRIESVSFAAGGKQVLTSSADGKIMLWDVAAGKVTRELVRKVADKEKGPRNFGRERIDLFRVRAGFSPNGKTIAGLWWGEKLHLFDAATGELKHQVGFPSGLTSFSFSPDSRYVVVSGQDGAIGAWDVATGKQARIYIPSVDPMDRDFDGFETKAFCTAFSADGRTLVVGGVQLHNSGLTYTVKQFETASGRERLGVQTVMHFFGDGGIALDRFSTALDNIVAGFALSPDGKLLAELGFSNIKLRSLRTGKEVRTFGGREITANTALFSPDGAMIVAGKYSGALRVWDVASGSVLLDFPAHDAQILALAFSPDGKWLISGAKDSSALVWDWEHIRKQAAKTSGEPALTGIDSLWTDLGSRDAARAHAAILALGSSPGQAVATIKTRLKPIAPVERKMLDRLIEDLDHASSDVRDSSQRSLEKLGDLAAEAIKERLKAAAPFEVVRRLEDLQRKLSSGDVNVETLQALRAIEVLEHIGSADARAVLESMSKGAAGHRVTIDAGASLQRLKKK